MMEKEATKDGELNRTLNRKDENGNRLIYQDTKVYLHQQNESKPRYLGVVQLTSKNNLKYTKYEEEKNIMRKNNSWSINYEILRQVDFIVYITNDYRYIIDQGSAIKHGTFLHYKGSGFERKLYVPLEFWEVRTNEGTVDQDTEWEAKFRSLVGSDNWFEKLKPVINTKRFGDLAKWIAKRRKEKTIYPETPQIFRAYRQTPLEDVKVVILGQDPYPSKHANGLAFGTDYKNEIPQSLETIFAELDRDLHFDFDISFEPSLESWAKQGVLLLNTALTVEKGSPNSHQDIGWEDVISRTIQVVNEKTTPVVFALWGKKAQGYEGLINQGYHKVLKASHPSAEQYTTNNAGFTKCGHFSEINQFLKEEKIQW
jgi:uracil-DNA glycosylase